MLNDIDDDVLFPSLGTFETMFTNVQLQAKEQTAKTHDLTPASSTSKPKANNGAGHVRKTAYSRKYTTNSMSKDTVDLLAELDELQGPGGEACTGTATENAKDKQAVSNKDRKRKGIKDPGEGLWSGKKMFELDPTQNGRWIAEVPLAVEYSTVRIRWKSEVLRFTKPQGTQMSKIRMDVSKKLNLRADNVVILDETDSVEVSDNLFIENIPFGTVLEVLERVNDIASKDGSKLVPDCIQLKVQGSKGHRERIAVVIRRTTHIKQLMDDFVEKFGYYGKKFKLVFDGDVTDLDETPESLDLDGGEMFDIVEVP